MTIDANGDMYILYRNLKGSWGDFSLHVTKVPGDFSSIPSSDIPTGVSGFTIGFTSTSVPTPSTTAAGWTWGDSTDQALSYTAPTSFSMTTSTADTPTWTTEEY
jgi:hypothetical protein